MTIAPDQSPTAKGYACRRLPAAHLIALPCLAVPGPHLSPVLSVIANILSVGVADEAQIDLAVATARLLDSEEVHAWAGRRVAAHRGRTLSQR